MRISFVVAASQNNVIGKNNQLLWYLPNDMKFFKNITWPMPVIMGRKTFESLHKKPLSGRINIIVTSHSDLKPEKGEIWLAGSIEQAIDKARTTDCNEVFIIGGGEIFKTAMPLADKIFLTRVEALLEGDTYFPEIDPADWVLSSSLQFPSDEKHAYPYSFQKWERRNS